MSDPGIDGRDGFTSKFGIICATAGSAIGLGNIWRFPYLVGENGGGAFILVYLGCILIMGMPIMLSELVIGRRGQLNTFGAFRKLAPGKHWWIIGVMGIAAAFMILAFYSTIAGWTLEYIVKSLGNAFQGKSSEDLAQMFKIFHTGTFRPLLWQLVFMALTVWIVLAGVKRGIEKYSKILMPFLVGILVIMSIRSLTLPGAMGGLKFLFKPDFSEINAGVLLAALGQAFFSLSIGMGAVITYGSYINRKNNLTSIAAQVSIADTLVAVLAGIAIFPAVFAFNIDPAEGPGLIFQVLPSIFQQLPGGYFFAIIFFVLLGIAALTSSISLLEVVVAFLVEELKLTRKKATFMAAVSAMFFGVFCTLSFGMLSNVVFSGQTIFGLFDFTASNILLPLGGLLIVLFVGWVMKAAEVKDELSNSGLLKVKLFSVFRFIIKFIAPVAIVFIFLKSVGIIKI